jgi:hypothetical protein
MTFEQASEHLERLRARIGRLGAALETDAPTPELGPLEAEIDLLAATLTHLPASEALDLRPGIVNLVADLDGLHRTLLRSRDGLAERLEAGGRYGRAATAYARSAIVR